MDWEKIVDKYYKGNAELKDILVRHSMSVAQKALRIVAAHPELGADRDFVYEASMLHDIGIIYTDAPGIKCYGTEPYIRHGILGADLLRKDGLPAHARVCERHTGAGLSLEDIVSQNLPLPHISLLPETTEEKIICYADKFFSKTRLDTEKTVEQAARSLAKFGDEGVGRFMEWSRMFE
ncbi:HDIG domain-containing metalloprotein [Xylanibacter caecicola]|uniref:HDIG domain-containing metalloprotein n=1 Tax=Xylanibacter caecicola TaxID=2736294 RepID=UPI00258F9861|nr:HDIG domain-containing metalloprotein [Xylanibacter caecicola]